MRVWAFRKKFYSVFFIFHLMITFLYGQEEDFQSWNMIAISKKIKTKYTSSLTTIYRINNNVTSFNDVSFDWRLNRKIKNGLSAQIVFRNWVFIKKKPVYFFWYDIVYVHKKPNYKWVNLLRLHHGLDWVGKRQADFLRMRNHFFYDIGTKNKITPFIGYDLWYRFNENNRFQSIWLEAGAEYQIKKFKFRLNYRRIGYFDDGPGLRRNIIVSGIFYKI